MNMKKSERRQLELSMNGQAVESCLSRIINKNFNLTPGDHQGNTSKAEWFKSSAQVMSCSSAIPLETNYLKPSLKYLDLTEQERKYLITIVMKSPTIIMITMAGILSNTLKI